MRTPTTTPTARNQRTTRAALPRLAGRVDRAGGARFPAAASSTTPLARAPHLRHHAASIGTSSVGERRQHSDQNFHGRRSRGFSGE